MSGVRLVSMTTRFPAALLLCLLSLRCGPLVAINAAANPQTIYFSVGDAQDLLYTPLESKASIESVFDVLHEKYKLHRV